MCGINGIVLHDASGARRVDRGVLERMRDVISHRGPDDCGAYVDGNAGLGHRRLSIVDVAAGHQPMPNEDATLHVVYNGEIYNHADHRPWLEARGHTYRTHCDTETILHLYEEKGSACVEDLRGMFAFAIWDSRRRELFVARDRFGVKPLYYVHTPDGSLYFASEIKALVEAGAVRPRLNYEALPDYLANHGTSGDATLFEGVRRLAPGHTLLWRDGRIRIEKYWDLSFAPGEGGDDDNSVRAKSDDEYVAEWSELFRDSVRMRLMADVPLGMFLSGGIDSSAIAAVMSGLVSEPIKTFSVAFAEREANELSYARLVAEKFKTDHHEVLVSPEEFFEALPRLVWHEDEPLAHPSSVALYFVSRLASEHVKVVLTGEGSDETLAGYERYYKTLLQLSLGPRYHRLVPGAVRRAVAGRIEALPVGSRVRHKLTRTFLCLGPDVDSLYFNNFAVFNAAQQRGLLTSEARERAGPALDPYAGMRGYFESSDSEGLLGRMLYADTKSYLHELLMKQDQMSMAASIESRVPFLDHRLVEYAARMPERMKLRRGLQTKYVLRRAMAGVLPEPILSRSKMGFPVPVGKWFRGEYKHLLDEYVTGPRAVSRGVFDPAFVRGVVARHLAGEQHSERLWALVNFEMWMRRFVDGEEPAGEPRREDLAEPVAAGR